MTFTDQIETNENDSCYYRKAYSPEIFNTLSIDEKRSLIAFTVKEFSKDISVVYSDNFCDEIGVLTEQDVVLINNHMLLQSKQTYPLELYFFLYNALMTRFVARKKNFVPVVEESYINKRWRKTEYRNNTLEVIILHLLLDELLDMSEVVLVNDEERKYFLGESQKIILCLPQPKENREEIRVESYQKQTEIAETNEVHLGRGR